MRIQDVIQFLRMFKEPLTQIACTGHHPNGTRWVVSAEPLMWNITMERGPVMVIVTLRRVFRKHMVGRQLTATPSREIAVTARYDALSVKKDRPEYGDQLLRAIEGTDLLETHLDALRSVMSAELRRYAEFLRNQEVAKIMVAANAAETMAASVSNESIFR